MYLIFFLVISMVQAEESPCTKRCNRIHQRSLDRVGFDDKKLRQLLERQRPLGTTKDLCWRVYDYLDCMEHCKHTESHDIFAKFVRSKCQFALAEMESALMCVTRYHSFIEVRCSTFLKEAERLRKGMDPSLAPTKEICRFLHLNTLCLENTVTMYCANAKKIFRRLNFRDYFLNFILPTNDTLLDDFDLDSCQMYDFVKKNTRRIEDHQLEKELATVINFFEAKNAVIRPATTSSSLTTLKERKEFTTLLDELLDESQAISRTELLDSSTATQMATVTQLFPYKQTTVANSIVATVATTTVTTTVSTTTTKLNTTTVRSPITFTRPNFTQQPDELSPEEQYDEDTDGMENIDVDVVPIERLNSSIIDISTTTELPKTSPKSRLFSDDSWEHTPPNFHYSSLRVLENGGVTPLNIDTTTLFGFDDDDEEDINDNNDNTVDNADDSDNDDKVENKDSKQISTEMKTPHQKESLEEELDFELDELVQQEDGMSMERNEHQAGETRVFASQSKASITEGKVRATLLESDVKSDNKIRNSLESLTTKIQFLNEKLNLLPPSSTSPSLPLLLDDAVSTKVQDWDEFNQNPEDGAPNTVRKNEDDEIEKNEEVLYPLDHTDVSVTVENISELPEVKSNWFDDEILMLIYCIVFGATTFGMICLLMCLALCRRGQLSITKPE